MKKKTSWIWGIVLIAACVGGFIAWMATRPMVEKEVAAEEPEVTEKSQDALVGGDRDEHGCIASAGYVWSELLQECIRPFERGVKLLPVESDDAVLAAYLVFGEDGSEVEVFMPQTEERPVLSREVIGLDEEVWTSTEAGTPVVRRAEGKYSLLVGDQVLFEEP